MVDEPNLALIVFYLILRAIYGSEGPHNYLKLYTAFSYLTSKAMHTPLVKASAIYGYSLKTPL
jgi:hypothetical protein